MAADGAEIDLYAEDLEHEFNQVSLVVLVWQRTGR